MAHLRERFTDQPGRQRQSTLGTLADVLGNSAHKLDWHTQGYLLTLADDLLRAEERRLNWRYDTDIGEALMGVVYALCEAWGWQHAGDPADPNEGAWPDGLDVVRALHAAVPVAVVLARVAAAAGVEVPETIAAEAATYRDPPPYVFIPTDTEPEV